MTENVSVSLKVFIVNASEWCIVNNLIISHQGSQRASASQRVLSFRVPVVVCLFVWMLFLQTFFNKKKNDILDILDILIYFQTKIKKVLSGSFRNGSS